LKTNGPDTLPLQTDLDPEHNKVECKASSVDTGGVGRDSGQCSMFVYFIISF